MKIKQLVWRKQRTKINKLFILYFCGPYEHGYELILVVDNFAHIILRKGFRTEESIKLYAQKWYENLIRDGIDD